MTDSQQQRLVPSWKSNQTRFQPISMGIRFSLWLWLKWGLFVMSLAQIELVLCPLHTVTPWTQTAAPIRSFSFIIIILNQPASVTTSPPCYPSWPTESPNDLDLNPQSVLFKCCRISLPSMAVHHVPQSDSTYVYTIPSGVQCPLICPT